MIQTLKTIDDHPIDASPMIDTDFSFSLVNKTIELSVGVNPLKVEIRRVIRIKTL